MGIGNGQAKHVYVHEPHQEKPAKTNAQPRCGSGKYGRKLSVRRYMSLMCPCRAFFFEHWYRMDSGHGTSYRIIACLLFGIAITLTCREKVMLEQYLVLLTILFYVPRFHSKETQRYQAPCIRTTLTNWGFGEVEKSVSWPELGVNASMQTFTRLPRLSLVSWKCNNYGKLDKGLKVLK
jgi:hypothetical protein